MQERSRGFQAHFLAFHSSLLCSQSSKLERSRTPGLETAILWANNGNDLKILTKSCESLHQAHGRTRNQ